MSLLLIKAVSNSPFSHLMFLEKQGTETSSLVPEILEALLYFIFCKQIVLNSYIPKMCHVFSTEILGKASILILPFTDVITEKALSPQLFKLRCWSGWGLNP